VRELKRPAEEKPTRWSPEFNRPGFKAAWEHLTGLGFVPFCKLKEHAMPTMEGRASNLTESDKESGKAVYGADNKKIGSIEKVMVDKSSGEIEYAVLSFGGFLGIGSDHYPVPWKVLRYDDKLGGYRSDINENRLKGAPKHGSESFDWGAHRATLDDYYNDEVLKP
jgi:PRC-barrel domain